MCMGGEKSAAFTVRFNERCWWTWKGMWCGLWVNHPRSCLPWTALPASWWEARTACLPGTMRAMDQSSGLCSLTGSNTGLPATHSFLDWHGLSACDICILWKACWPGPEDSNFPLGNKTDPDHSWKRPGWRVVRIIPFLTGCLCSRAAGMMSQVGERSRVFTKRQINDKDAEKKNPLLS